MKKKYLTVVAILFITFQLNAESAINYLTRYGRLDQLKDLLELGSNPNEYDDFLEGETPLMTSMYVPANFNNTPDGFYEERREVVALLLDFKANPNLLSKKKNESPLTVAIRKRAISIVELLLSKGANPNLSVVNNLYDIYPAGSSPLHVASYSEGSDKISPEIVRILIKFGGKVNSFDKNKNTPLHIIAKEGNYSIAEILVENGANKKAKNKEGKTPFEIALSAGRIELAKLLKE
ncbi:MAG: ankyrin repeat domain-containing protein [Leptospira sp.]|nr:ankyrin repeat domain-containing protein [Leptospira sp.]